MYFVKWKTYHTQHVDIKLKYEQAVHHHGNIVKVKVMRGWTYFTKESMRKSVS